MIFEIFAGAPAPFGVGAVQYLILCMRYQQNLKTVAAITGLVPHDASTISRTEGPTRMATVVNRCPGRP